MALRDDEDELEQIVQKEKPGFTIEKRGEASRARKDVSLPSDGTPDTQSLRAKARELGAKANPGGRKRAKGAASSDPLIEKYLGGPSSADDEDLLNSPAIQDDAGDDVRIVDVRPVHASDNPDRSMRPKKVIISRSAKKIIGEQG